MATILLGKSVFPSARQHPRAAELVKIDEEYFLERWAYQDSPQREQYFRAALTDFACKG